MDQAAHWNAVYVAKPREALSWHAPHLELSLAWIEAACPDRRARLIDAGGGLSSLAGDLIQRGYTNLTVVDLAQTAMTRAHSELGEAASRVRWLTGDITTVALDAGAYDLWHDRALFHFLTEREQRRAYVAQVERALRPGGQVIVGAFAREGPKLCSGLEVARYDAATLARELGPQFRLLESRALTHRSSTGAEQAFVYCRLERRQDRADRWRRRGSDLPSVN